jgi:hypothetical protein
MYTAAEIEKIRQRMARGDVKATADAYERITSRRIAASYITMFLSGERPVLGTGVHQPENILAALHFVIETREHAERRRREILEKILASQASAIREAAIT